MAFCLSKVFLLCPPLKAGFSILLGSALHFTAGGAEPPATKATSGAEPAEPEATSGAEPKSTSVAEPELAELESAVVQSRSHDVSSCLSQQSQSQPVVQSQSHGLLL